MKVSAFDESALFWREICRVTRVMGHPWQDGEAQVHAHDGIRVSVSKSSAHECSRVATVGYEAVVA
jgi:hypothetical protein